MGLPLQLIPIPHPCSDSEYAVIMENFIEQTKSKEIDSFANEVEKHLGPGEIVFLQGLYSVSVPLCPT